VKDAPRDTPRPLETTKPEATKTVVAKAAVAPVPEPEATLLTSRAVEPAPERAHSVTISGCLESDEGTYRLTDASGANTPTSRSWKSGFLKKRAAHIDLADGVGTLSLRNHIGRRVAATGTLVDRDMRVDSVRPIGTCD
jgi:hypothetical protein